MPIYEYLCRGCGKKFERVVNKITSDANVCSCDCGEEADKIPSLSSFHLKGGGWYKDGYSNCSDANKKGKG